MAEARESRPVASGPAQSISTAIKAAGSSLPSSTDADDLARCMVCSHRLYVAASIAAGMGPQCRRALTRALRGADSEVVEAVLAAIAALSGVKR